MGGGIIINRAKVALTAVTDPCFYESLSPANKATVDSIDAKDPASRTHADVLSLTKILHETAKT